MDVLQQELDEVRDMWNTHLIVHRRNENQVYGIPDELYHIPEVQGIIHIGEALKQVYNYK